MRLYTSDACIYEGMDTDTIIRIRAELGKLTTFIDETDFANAVAAKQGN